MTVKRETLADLFVDIRNTLIDKLEKHELLKDVKSVVYGERKRIGTLKSPAIWIVTEPYSPELRGGRTAQHDFTFNFVALVKGSNPEDDLKEAERISLTIYDVLTEDRTLNNKVSDVRPLRVDPAYEAGNSTQLCWASVQFGFRLQRRE